MNDVYYAALRSNYHVGMLNKLRSCYYRCLKIFFGFSRRDSLTNVLFFNILFNLGLPSFDVSYSRLWNSCSNCV